ncbi:MAG: DUF86 domain-containing protein [Microgenomates group bacterium]|nr:DUF86 domain-containing protein [Microgenomates group bacterium]
MTNVRVLIKKISEVEKYFQMVKKYRKYKPEEIIKNDERYGALQRYLYLLCQSTIDLAEAVISYYSFRVPGNYGEIFQIFQENNLIDRNLSEKMIKMTGFRNLLAHVYGEIDFEKLYQVLVKDIDDINKFLDIIKNKIKL